MLVLICLRANMHSLLNAEAKDLGILEKCEAAGVSLIVGGPFSSGILATGADPPGSSRDSQKGAPKCKAQWIGAHSSGPRTIDPALSPLPCCFNSLSCYTASNVALMNIPIPEGLWKELENEGLLP